MYILNISAEIHFYMLTKLCDSIYYLSSNFFDPK